MTRINLRHGKIPPMPDDYTHHILFSIRDSPTFPAALWHRFKATVKARADGTPVDVLRRLIERYLDEGPKP